MRNIGILFSFVLAAGVARANPQVIDSDPHVLVADEVGRPQFHSVTLYGNNIMLPTTTPANLNTDVQMWATAPGHPWQQVVNGGWAQITEMTSGELTVRVYGLESPGNLQFQICVRTQGCMTAYYSVPIRARATYAPRLWDPNGETYKPISASVPPGDYRRQTYFYFDGLNDVDSTCIYIEGTIFGSSLPIARLDAGDGWGIFYMPTLSVGDHYIWISNTGCTSGHWSVANVIHVGLSLP